MKQHNSMALIDGSKLMTESLVRAGADVFVGYPITPANLFYQYSKQRFRTFLAAPDEITTLQWMCGFATTGSIPVTATSFPGYALMVETINMAYMMELPMIIVLIQRLGPATGTATCGAQGDLNVVYGTISGGYTLPCFSISSTDDCWNIPPQAVRMAVELRTPVVLLTSKEEVMTYFSYDISNLSTITPVSRDFYNSTEPYKPYEPSDNQVPAFLPVSDNSHQVRITASTHDQRGIIRNTATEAINNSLRLNTKITANINEFTCFEYDRQSDASLLILTYGITASAAREAFLFLREKGVKISLLVAKTLSPIPDEYFDICDKYAHIVIAEENFDGILRKIMFGTRRNEKISGVNLVGRMIEPHEIVEKVMQLITI